MAISTHFQSEIDQVDATKTLVFHSGEAGYGDLEWSYNGLDIYGGSDLACEQGASALLYEMGFRFYSPNESFYYRPASIPINLTATKQENWFKDLNIWLAYGHSWGGVNAASRTLLNDAYKKWARLNGCNESLFPAGHRWSNIISTNSAWFAANPQVLSDADSFALATLQDAVDQTDYNNLVNICAAQILLGGFNAGNRTNFDPSDGDGNPSNRVFSFTADVVAKVRAGSDAIGTHPARTGNPAAELGVYAYAGHRLPPTGGPYEGVYTQVALAFNNTGLTYLDLVTQHAEKAERVLLRDYLDTQVWSQSKPFSVKVRASSAGSWTSYDNFHAAGAIGVNSEFAANWLNNLAGTANVLRKFKTGTSDYFNVLQEMVDLIFNGDQAVYDLYVLLGDTREGYSTNNLKRIFDIVNRMEAGWYKTLYQQWATILWEFESLPAQTPLLEQDASDPFPVAFSKLMSHVTGVRDSDIMHSYAFMRQQANSVVYTNYPDLWMNANPVWFTNPVAPSALDFSVAYAQIYAATERDADLDSADLVLVKGITPLYPFVGPTSGTGFNLQKGAKFKVVGPASITVTVSGEDEVIEFDAGIHDLYLSYSEYSVSPTSGLLFLDMLGSTRFEGANGSCYLYIPSRCAGNVSITSDTRLTINDGDGELDIVPATDPSVVAALTPGQVWINSSETRGTHSFGNVNRYVSLLYDTMLMPRVVANEDFGTLIRLLRPGTALDTQAPTTPGTPVVTSEISNAIALAWAGSTDDSGVVNYDVYRDDVIVGSTQEPSYVDTGLTPETTYTYKVVAKDPVNNRSEASGTVQGTTTAADTTAPSVPTNLAVTEKSPTTITLNWDDSTDDTRVAGYYIYRDTVLIATRANSAFKDSGLTPSTAYSYTVSAYDDAGNESAQSASAGDTTDAPDVVAPTTPTNLAISAVSDDGFTITWTASTDNVGVAGYRIYVDSEVVGTDGGSPYVIDGLTPGTTYSIQISAYDLAGNESALSSAVEGTTT